MTNRQEEFYALLDKYNQGTEPLSSWESFDLARLEQIIDAELAERGNNLAAQFKFIGEYGGSDDESIQETDG